MADVPPGLEDEDNLPSKRASPVHWHLLTVGIVESVYWDDIILDIDRVEMGLRNICSYYVIGCEEGKGGYNHLQCTVKMRKRYRPSFWSGEDGREIFPSNFYKAPHSENKLKDIYEAISYVKDKHDPNCKHYDGSSLGEGFIFEWGNPGVIKGNGGGERTDMTDLRDAIKSGMTASDIFDWRPDYYFRFNNSINKALQTVHMPIKIADKAVYIVAGAGGSGKTDFAYFYAPLGPRGDGDVVYDPPVGTPTGVWWCGYENQPHVILDDFGGAKSGWKLKDTLRLLGDKRCLVPVKHGHTWLRASTIWIPTATHPLDWYDWAGRDDEQYQLQRRITGVYLTTGQPFHFALHLRGSTTFHSWWDSGLRLGALAPPSQPRAHVETPTQIIDLTQ